MTSIDHSGTFTLGDRAVRRLGYGAMQLAGPDVFGPPKDQKAGDDGLIGDLARDGIAYVPFFPLGGFSPLQSSTLSEIAKSLDATPMQVALAWLLRRAPNILLIPGTSSLSHLCENLAAAALTLPDAAVGSLDGIAAGGVFA